MVSKKDFDYRQLRCFNSITGKRDGGYCVWEGGGKCLKCEAADKIQSHETKIKKLTEALKETSDMVEGELIKYRHFPPSSGLETMHRDACQSAFDKAQQTLKELDNDK